MFFSSGTATPFNNASAVHNANNYTYDYDRIDHQDNDTSNDYTYTAHYDNTPAAHHCCTHAARDNDKTNSNHNTCSRFKTVLFRKLYHRLEVRRIYHAQNNKV